MITSMLTLLMIAVQSLLSGLVPVSSASRMELDIETSIELRNNSSSRRLAKRDVCSGNSSFSLGQTYRQKDCASPNAMLPGGMCDWWKKQKKDTQCGFFCQVSTRFLPAEEVPIPGTYCYGPKHCSIAHDKGMLQVESSSWVGTDQELYALQHGITGGFMVGARTVMAGRGDVVLREGECGYFAWIGTKKVVCGSLTTAQKRDSTSGGRPICHTPAQTAGNVCVDQLWGGPEDDVGAFGKTVFVRVDCATRAPLPKEKQDPLFKYDGVSMSPERLDGILQAWAKISCKHWFKFFYYAFEVKGHGLKGSELGYSGINYLNAMRSCGAAVTGWHFEYTPDDDEYDWKASGAADIINSDCVGTALEKVGANSGGECHGR